MPFSFEIEAKKKYTLIVPKGNLLTLYDAKEMLEKVDGEPAECKNYVVDLGELEHLSSEGLNALLHILTRSRNAGGETILCNLSTHLESLFIITKLSNIFSIVKDRKSAVAELK